MVNLIQVSSNKVFGGYQKIFSHNSTELKCIMKFSIFLPQQCEEKKLPVIYWLSGLSCDELNFFQKAGAQQHAARAGTIIVCPDTSPRGVDIPGDRDNWDFGVAAGFYVDATEKPWANNYRMYTYVTKELIDIIGKSFPVLPGTQSIMGHSMGGHGALICALKNPGLYKSVSAFSPICNPMNCPWGKKAFTGYLGGNVSSWEKYDSCKLIKLYDGPPLELFIDQVHVVGLGQFIKVINDLQGTEDNFLHDKQLLPENLIEACKEAAFPIIYKKRDGYDHSYYYIATFIEEHIKYHIMHLGSLK